MISCTKSKDNIDMFYFKGKRITAKKALQLQQKKGLIISECDTVYNRSSKPVREVMKKVDECETRYTATKQLYDDLYNRLTDAAEQIEVMNRICMSREFKEQLDENFRRETDQLNDQIRFDQTKIKELNTEKEALLKRVDENVNNINDLTDLLQRSKEELQIIKEMNEEEKRVKTDIKNKLDDLTSLCSDRPALQKSVKMLMSSLNEQRALFQDKEATLQGQIIDYEDEIKRTLGQLKTSEEKFVKTLESLEENQKLLQNLRTDIDKLQRENGSLMNENNELQKDVLSGKEAARILEELKVDMENKLERESNLMNDLKQERDNIVQKDLELTRVKEGIEEWMGKFKKLEDECADRPQLFEKISQLEKFLESRDLDLKASSENELVLTSQVNDIQKRLDSTNKILKDLENECSDRPQLLLKVDQLQSFVDDSTDLLKKRDNELISIRTVLASTEDKYEKEVDNSNRLKTQQKKTEKELADIYDQSAKQLEKSNKDKIDFQGKLIKLQNEIKDSNKALDEAISKYGEEQSKNNKTQNDLAKSVKQIEELDGSVNLLKEQLNNREKEIEIEKSENNKLKERLEKELAKLDEQVSRTNENQNKVEELSKEIETLKELKVNETNEKAYNFEKLNIELQQKNEIIDDKDKEIAKLKKIVEINLKINQTEKENNKRLQRELSDEKLANEKLLELSKERQKGCKNVVDKLEEAEKKINELRNCCDDNRKLLVNVQELKGEIEAIKMVAKSEGPSAAVMEMRIRSLRKKYKY